MSTNGTVGWLIFPRSRRGGTVHRLVQRRGDAFYEGDCQSVAWTNGDLNHDFPGWTFAPIAPADYDHAITEGTVRGDLTDLVESVTRATWDRQQAELGRNATWDGLSDLHKHQAREFILPIVHATISAIDDLASQRAGGDDGE